MTTLDDATPLDGAQVDVAARIAWTLRMARLTSEVADTRLRTVAAAIGTSAARLSRIETGRIRDGSVTDRYEHHLGCAEGSLRAPVDILCRTFPRQAPAETDPGAVVASVRELSELTDRLAGEGDATGGAWLRWARSMATPGNIGMPEALAARLVTRLVHELARSCGVGYPARYEALSLIRCSAYGHLVLEVARQEVATPHSQSLADLLSAVGEAVTDDAVTWCLELLRDERAHVAQCGALGLENMGEIAGASFWAGVAPRLVAAYDVSEEGSPHEEWVAHLLRLAPARVLSALPVPPSRPLPPAPEVAGFDRVETNHLWQSCVDAARTACHAAGVPDQPLLARLVFDIAFGHWEARAVTSYMLLTGLPVLAAATSEQLAGLVDHVSDERLRARAARRLAGALQGFEPAATRAWLASEEPALQEAALRLAGAAGRQLPEAELDALLRAPATRRAALQAAGMSGHPALASVPQDPTLSEDVRGAARWWREHGPRLPV